MPKVINALVSTLLVSLPIGTCVVKASMAQDLQSFGVVSGQSLTNTGPTTIVGNIAVSPGTSYTGSNEVTQTGETFLGDAVALRIQNDLTTLYTVLEGRPTSQGGDLTGQDLGGMTLQPGVYNFDTSAGIAAGQTLILDGGGDPDAIFIFNIGSTLTAGSGATVVLQNGAQGGNVFYRVGSSATLDTTSDLQGQIIALTSITMNTEASIGCGAAQARNGSVTLDTNTIEICTLDATGFEVIVPPADEGFIHRAGPADTFGNVTYLDDPLLNGRPDADVSVTPNWNPMGRGGVYNDHPVGVLYDEDAGMWFVYNEDGARMPRRAAFNVAVSGATG